MSAPTPLAQGSLADSPLAHVMLSAHRRKLTGTLAVWPDEERPSQDRVLLQNGVIVGAKLLDPSPALDRGLLPLFRRERAPYAFYDADLVGDDEGALRGTVSVPALVAAALRGGLRDSAVATVLGSFSGSMLRLTSGLDLASLELTGKERAIVELLQAAPATLEDVLAQSGDEKTARRVLYLLGLISAIEQFRGTQLDPGGSLPAAPRPSAEATLRGASQGAARPSTTSADDRRKRHGIVEPPMPPPPPEDLTPAEAERYRDIAERYAASDKQNYFELLGIPDTATGDAARDAYFELVKTVHPDRLSAALAPIRPFAEQLFRLLTEARDQLSDEAKRMAYVRAVKSGGGTPESERKVMAVLAAAHELDKANVLVNVGKWAEALETLREAKALDPTQIDVYALEAWVTFNLIGQHPDAKVEAVVMLCDRALADAKDGYHERAAFTKALALKKQGREDVAVELFRKIAQKNPRHLDAAREVRLYEMRHRDAPRPSVPSGSAGSGKKPAAGKDDGGIFSKLFGGKKDG